MSSYSLSHLADAALLRGLNSIVDRDRSNLAMMLAYLAEVDSRQLYRPAAYPSMHAYCVGVLRFSEDSAYKRITAARKARLFPAIFAAVAGGRLHLTAISMLAPYLDPNLTQNEAGELIEAAAHKTKAEIAEYLAGRFTLLDIPTEVRPIAPSETANTQLAPERVANQQTAAPSPEAPRPRTTPLSPERFALQLTMSKTTHDKLRHAQALLAHQVSSGDIAEVLDRALDALIARLEKRKFATTSSPRPRRQSVRTSERYVPAHVRRAVFERDGGQCTFTGEDGHRCAAMERLEFDHIVPVARGGEATIDNVRLRCRAHNQFEAEQVFGAEFMENKREEARRAKPTEPNLDVIPWLRRLGYRTHEARRAAKHCEDLIETTLEERMRAALAFLRAPHRTIPAARHATAA